MSFKTQGKRTKRQSGARQAAEVKASAMEEARVPSDGPAIASSVNAHRASTSRATASPAGEVSFGFMTRTPFHHLRPPHLVCTKILTKIAALTS